jgi:DNA repair protein SbcD/Mre11
MRIVHLADTHLGHRYLTKSDASGRNEREQDIYKTFNAAIDRIVELKPDAVVHAGDLFDGFHPSTQAIEVALDGFERLDSAGIPTVVCSGNHSTPRYRATQHVFSLLDRYGCVNAVWEHTGFFHFEGLTITAIPHDHSPNALENAVAAARPDPDADHNVLVLHAGSDLLPRIGSREGGVVDLDPAMLEELAVFDYVALGHFHKFKPMRINACYAGSLERLSFNDDAEQKVIVEVNLDSDPADASWITTHPVPTRNVSSLPPIDAQGVEDLTAAVLEALEGIDLTGAVLRCEIEGVSQEVYRTLDVKEIERRTRPCLHFELKPRFAGAGRSTPRSAGDIRAHVIAVTPDGVDQDEVLRRAEEFLAQSGSRVEE